MQVNLFPLQTSNPSRVHFHPQVRSLLDTAQVGLVAASLEFSLLLFASNPGMAKMQCLDAGQHGGGEDLL